MSTIPTTQPDQRILLADDDDKSRAFLADNLTADGYLVDVAEDRDRGLARLRVAEVDLILVDVNGTTLSLIDWGPHGGPLAVRDRQRHAGDRPDLPER